MSTDLSWSQQLIENSKIGTIITDKQLNILYINGYLSTIFGYEKSEFVGKKVEDLCVSQNSFKKFFDLISEAIKKREALHTEYPFKYKDGSTIILKISGTLLDEGKIGWSVVDITEHVNKEQELLKIKEQMEIALSTFKAGVWEWNITDNSVYISPQWKKMLGYSENEIENSYDEWKSRIHPDDIQQVVQNIDQMIKVGKHEISYTFRLKHKSGKWLWVLARSTIVHKEDETISLIGIHTDITEQKEMELQYARQAQMVEQVQDILLSTDANGYITSWNRGAQKILEYTKEEILHKHITTIRPKEEQWNIKHFFLDMEKHGNTYREVKLIKKDGSVIIADLSVSLLHDENGKVIGTVGYARDITRKKEIERELEKQKEMLHHLAHHDSLTGLPNRLLFRDRLQMSLERAKRNKTLLAVMFIDLDHFKEINDTYGHDMGDAVLKEVTKLFQKRLRKGDTLARLGGDEFALIMEDIKDSKNATILAQNLVDIFKKPLLIDPYRLHLSCSIGISIFPNNAENARDLLLFADEAMYRVKEASRNGFAFYKD